MIETSNNAKREMLRAERDTKHARQWIVNGVIVAGCDTEDAAKALYLSSLSTGDTE